MPNLVKSIAGALSAHDQLGPLVERARAFRSRKKMAEVHRTLDAAYVDPRIQYPAYASMDDHIDLERLRSLEPILRERLAPRADPKFWTGSYTLNVLDNRNAGSKIIDLASNKRREGAEYFDLDKPEYWEPSEHAAAFPEVVEFIRTLPFKSTGRIIIMYDFNAKRVPAHRDHERTDLVHDFIWFRPSRTKPFYVMNGRTGEKKYIEGYSAWFDTVNQFHGADATEGFSISLRVDGVFTDELRARIPVPSRNLASTSALWASIGDVGTGI